MNYIGALVALMYMANISYANLIHDIFELNNISSDLYMGQLAENGKEKAGMGILFEKNGNIYAGDFIHSKPEGKGVFITSGSSSIPNCEGAVVYYGNWIKGKKNGNGACYNQNGELIYKGLFENDKPIGTYPSDNIEHLSFSSLKYEGGGVYIGEISDNIPSGFGIYKNPEGVMWIGKYKNGTQRGIQLVLLCGRNDWWGLGEIKNGQLSFVTSSESYNQYKEAHKLANSILKKNNTELLLKSLSLLSDTIEEITRSKTGQSAGDTKEYPIIADTSSNSNHTLNSSENHSDESLDSGKSTKNKEALNQAKEKEQQSTFEKNNLRNYRKMLDSIEEHLWQLKNNPPDEPYENIARKARQLQKQAKNKIKEYKEKSGGHELSFNQSLLNWKP